MMPDLSHMCAVSTTSSVVRDAPTSSAAAFLLTYETSDPASVVGGAVKSVSWIASMVRRRLSVSTSFVRWGAPG